MKTLAIIWAVALVTGVTSVAYVNSTINELVTQAASARVYTGAQVQPAALGGSTVLQPAAHYSLPINPQANQAGGNGQNIELQPALGYGALGETIQ
jgi:hypothetical protein